MTEKEFLESISYETNKKEMSIFYKFQRVCSISFEGVEDKLEDDQYCSNLAEEVVLQSSLAKNLINQL